MFVSILTIKLFHLKKQNTNTVIVIHPHIKLSFRRPLRDHKLQFPTIPLSVCLTVHIRLLHVTSPYSRKIADDVRTTTAMDCGRISKSRSFA